MRQRQSPCECEAPGGDPTQIGSGDGTHSGHARARREDDRPRITNGQRIGSTGIRYERGFQSIDADTAASGDLARTRALLERTRESTGADAQVRFRIGEESLTSGQLLRELDRNPDRFTDFLRQHGISLAELDQLLDDVVATGVSPGTELDLRPGSELARAYRIGGADGEVVDSHLDRSETEQRAAGHRSLEQRIDVSRERVEGPNFFEMIGEALAEAAAWIARLFGSSWNPDTMTFNGRVDDAHFRRTGRDLARTHGPAMQALLTAPGGERALRESLLSQRPRSATEAQWQRAVDGIIRGARAQIDAERAAGRLPRDLSAREAEHMLLYLRANDFSAEARTDVATVLEQPSAIRSQALELLTELPGEERANMLGLFANPVEPTEFDDDAGWRAYSLQSAYQGRENDPLRESKQLAIFETMRRDGFRHGVSSHLSGDLSGAVDMIGNVPDAMRQRYLDLLPQLGLERAHLLGDYSNGLAVTLGRADSTQQERILSSFEHAAQHGTTSDLRRILGAGEFHLRLTNPNAGQLNRTDQRVVLDRFERHNLSLRFTPEGGGDPIDIDVARYFSDASYRSDLLSRTGMDRARFEGMLRNLAGSLQAYDGNMTARTATIRRLERDLAGDLSATERAAKEQELASARLELEANAPAMNVELDISPGSRLHTLFNLSGGGRSTAIQLAEERVLNNGGDFELTLRTRSGARHTITHQEMAELIRNPGEGRTPDQAFRERYPGLDYGETLNAFARVGEMYGNTLEIPDEGMLTVDLTRRHPNRDVDRLRRELTDGRIGNVSPGSTLSTTIAGTSTSGPSDPATLIPDARVGGVAGNNWFQYGWFSYANGYFSANAVLSDARAAYRASGNRADPAHAFNALYNVDRFRYRSSGQVQQGIVHGNPDDFLRDPRTGESLRGQDVQVLTFSGRGNARERPAFRLDGRNIRDMFVNYGGVPRDQVESHDNPTPDQMYRAIEAEILRDPRPADQRDRQRTLFVYYSGHTTSWSDTDGVAGLMLTGSNGQRQYFRPDQMARLNQLAREQGVNLVWYTDACRAGEFVHQARAEDVGALEAAGTLPPAARSLLDLRSALQSRHQAVFTIRENGSRPDPMPTATELEQAGTRALRDGADSQAMRDLRALRDRVEASDRLDDTDKYLVAEYVRSIEQIIEARTALAGTPDLDPAILSHGLVTGDTQWRPGRSWKTQQLGGLADRIGAELRERLQPPPSTRDAATP